MEKKPNSVGSPALPNSRGKKKRVTFGGSKVQTIPSSKELSKVAEEGDVVPAVKQPQATGDETRSVGMNTSSTCLFSVSHMAAQIKELALHTSTIAEAVNHLREIEIEQHRAVEKEGFKKRMQLYTPDLPAKDVRKVDPKSASVLKKESTSSGVSNGNLKSQVDEKEVGLPVCGCGKESASEVNDKDVLEFKTQDVSKSKGNSTVCTGSLSVALPSVKRSVRVPLEEVIKVGVVKRACSVNGAMESPTKRRADLERDAVCQTNLDCAIIDQLKFKRLSLLFAPTSPLHYGLPKEAWVKILGYLNFTDLKLIREMSKFLNNLVQESDGWTDDGCFLVDGKFIGPEAEPLCPEKLICADNTLCWPDIMLRGINREMQFQKFWRAAEVRDTIVFVQVYNCLLSSKTFHNLITSLPKMEELSYIISEKFFAENDVCANFAVGHHQKGGGDIICWKETAAHRSRLTSSKNKSKLRILHLNVCNLHLTNLLLAVLETASPVLNQLEAFRITLSTVYCLFKNYEIGEDSKLTLNAKKLIQRSQDTLMALSIVFSSEERGRTDTPISDDILDMRSPVPMVVDLLNLKNYSRLSLVELKMLLPNGIPAYYQYSGEGFTQYNMRVRSIKAHPAALKLVAQFSQKSMKNLIIGRVNLDGKNTVMCPNDMRKIKVIPSSSTIALLGTIVLNESNGKDGVPKFDYCKYLLRDLKIINDRPNDNGQQYAIDLLSKMPDMSEIRALDIRNKAKMFPSFEVPKIVSKFGNLTALLLADVRVRPDGVKSSPKLTDVDFQTIIRNLGLLEELVVKANLDQVTDFAFTGISKEACARMNKQNSYKREPGDVTGLALTNLKNMYLLELNGLTSKVTNVTAYLALKASNNLRELYLESPQFTKVAKLILKDKFMLRKGSQICI